VSPAFDYADMADVYDACVRFNEDIPFFLDACRGVLGPVLELMSGTGRVSLPLLESGVRLTCVDSSGAMLGVLGRKLATKGLSAPILREDVTRLELPPTFEMALLPFHSFAELLAEGDRKGALASIHAALLPGGRFLCTLHNPPVRLKTVGRGLETVSRGSFDNGEIRILADLVHDAESNQVHGTQILEILDEAGETREKRTWPLRFALIEATEFEALARTAGFEVEALWGDYSHAPFVSDSSPYMIWMLRKPAERGDA